MTRTVFVQCVAKKSQASSAVLVIPPPKYRLLSTSYYSTLLLNGLAALNLISGKCFVNFQFFSNPESPPPTTTTGAATAIVYTDEETRTHIQRHGGFFSRLHLKLPLTIIFLP